MIDDKSEEYRRFAEFCMRMARTTRLVELRSSWAELAEHWLTLMHRLDKKSWRETDGSPKSDKFPNS